MADTRARIGKQLEKSATPGSVIRTTASNEQEYVAPGTPGQALIVNASNVPEWQDIVGGALVNHTPIAFVPTATGNATNLNEIVTDPDGNVWYIDGNGDAEMIECHEGFKIDTSNLTVQAPVSVGPYAIDDLTDADTTTVAPVTGDLLKWDGTNWVPETVALATPACTSDLVDIYFGADGRLKTRGEKAIHSTLYFPNVNALTNGATSFIQMSITNTSSCNTINGTFIGNHHTAYIDSVGAGTATAGTTPQNYTQVLVNGVQVNEQTSAFYAGGTGSWNAASGIVKIGASQYKANSIDISNGANYASVSIAPGSTATFRINMTIVNLSDPNILSYWQDLSITFIGSSAA